MADIILIINNYEFSRGRLFEVKFMEVKDRQSRYQWYLILDNQRYDLKFKHIGDHTRDLEGVLSPTNRITWTIHLDTKNLYLVISQKEYPSITQTRYSVNKIDYLI